MRCGDEVSVGAISSGVIGADESLFAATWRSHQLHSAMSANISEGSDSAVGASGYQRGLPVDLPHQKIIGRWQFACVGNRMRELLEDFYPFVIESIGVDVVMAIAA